MGFWYLLLLLIGVVIFALGFIKILTGGRVKAIVHLSIGGLFIAVSIFLLSPNGSEIIADFLNLQ